MAGVVNLAKKFEKWVDEAFARESILNGATNNKVDFTGVNEVSVYAVDKMAMNDYQRSGTSRYGTDPRYSNTAKPIASGGSVTATEGMVIKTYAYADGKYPSDVVEKVATAG